jgi:putative transposase
MVPTILGQFGGLPGEGAGRTVTINAQTREKRPAETRNWPRIGSVYLNPEGELSVVVKVA